MPSRRAPSPTSRCHRALWLGVAALSTFGCTTTQVPDPKDAALAYADAAKRGDAAALHGMLSARGQKALSPADLERIVKDERVELAEQAKALEGPGTKTTIRATVRYPDGETASLAVEEGQLRITAADALPSGARTPEEALGELRRVLARRSYAGLVRVLSSSTRSAIEADLRALVEGLTEPESLHVEVTGETAVVLVPGGHRVRLRREEGVWRVDDLE